nr:hypothetical protein [Bacteroides sp.]
MKQNDILNKVDRRTGMTVPDGYFNDFAARMAASLPEQPWEREQAERQKPAPRNFWQTVRPYVYMAAMFAGVWLMMNLFDHIRPSNNLSIDSNPVLAEALSNDTFIDEYFLGQSDTDELVDEIWNGN